MVEPERLVSPRPLTVADAGAPPAPAESGDPAVRFDAYYYSHDCGQPYERTEEWLGLFARLADRIIEDLHPERVIDVGCAKGFLVEALCERGVDAWGIDISEYAIGEVHPSVADRCFVAGITGDLPDVLPGEFDLVTCIEVVEHIPATESAAAIEGLSALAPRVLFSSDPNDYAEATHLSVRPEEDWSALFARHGLFRNLDVDVAYLTPWAALYERLDGDPSEIVRRYERTHVRLRDEIRDVRATAVRLQGALADLEASRDGVLAGELDAARERIEALETELATHERILESRSGRALRAYHAARAALRRNR